MTLSRQKIDHPTSSSSLSTWPTMTSSTEMDHSDHPPAIVSSESMERQVRRDLCGIGFYPEALSSEHVEKGKNGETRWLSQPKKPKPNKTKTTIKNGATCVIPKYRNGFRENIVDDRHRDSRASSSHEPSLEPTFKRREDLRKHSVYTHFPTDRNFEICHRTKITRAPCRRRNGRAVPRAENFGDLTIADHKVLSDNCESRNIHRYAVVVQDLATQWIQSYPCKTKTSQETHGSLRKFLDPNRKPEVIYTDNSLDFGEALEELSWSHCTSTPRRSETNGLRREQYAEWRKAPLLYCCNQVSMKVGGQIP